MSLPIVVAIAAGVITQSILDVIEENRRKNQALLMSSKNLKKPRRQHNHDLLEVEECEYEILDDGDYYE